MKPTRRSALVATCIGAFAFAAAGAFAQDAPPPHKPLEKTIGQTRPEIVPSLIVMNSDGAELAEGKLTLKGVAGNSIVFADRPIRSAGHAPTSVLLDEWNPGYPDGFYADPPNATVSVFGSTEKEVYDAVIVLKDPKIAGADLIFDVDILEGSLDGSTGPAALFIDRIGRPMSPGSFAGAARRTARRGAFYAGANEANAVNAVQDTTQPCGYYPYPPCRNYRY